MQTYVLLLLGILVVLLVGVIYFGWRKIINLEIESNKNKYDIEALRGLLSKILSEEGQFEQVQNAERIAQYQGAMNNIQESQDYGEEEVVEKRIINEVNLPVREEESDVDTLESTDEKMPEDLESTVSVESINSEDTEEKEETEDETEDEEAQKMIEKELELEETEEVGENTGKDSGDEPEIESETEEEQINLEEKEEEVKNDVDIDEYNKRLEEMVTKTADIKKGKRLPNEAAKSFKIGYKMVSQNDGKMYEVVGRGNGKRWKQIELE